MLRQAPALPPAREACRRLNVALWFFVAGAVIGAPWDRLWHWTQRFDVFFSPPHVFMYTMAAASAAVLFSIAVRPPLRAAFGRGLKLPRLAMEIPYPLLLLGSGLACLGAASLLDNYWHTANGLDETSWSTPHALLWWGFYLGVLGFVSSRLALSKAVPMSRFARAALGALVLATAMTVVLGPFAHNSTPETVGAIAATPTIATEPPLQHMYRIYLVWNLDQTNPVFPALASAATAMGLALLGPLRGKGRIEIDSALLATAVMGSYGLAVALALGVAASPTNWLPLPMIPAAVALCALRGKGVPESLAFAATGATVGLACAIVWNAGPLGLLSAAAAAPLAVVAGRAGIGIARVVDRPTPRAVAVLALTAGALVPVLVGLLDLRLRTLTP